MTDLALQQTRARLARRPYRWLLPASIAACLALVAAGGTILKKSWYDRLEKD